MLKLAAVRCHRVDVSIEQLEARRLLSDTPVNPASAIPFDHIVVDPNPGVTPVIKVLGDVNGDGKLDAIIGYETASGGPGGIYWYQFPASGNPHDAWLKHPIVTSGNAYESSVPVDLNHDSAVDLVISFNSTIVWFENPHGHGGNPATDPWTEHVIGNDTIAHEMYLADLDGDGKLDVVTNDAIFFQNSPASWTQLSTANYQRTQKGLALFDSGSGLGSVDLIGTGESPYSITWWENPRDHGGNARTDRWIPHVIGPGYDTVHSGVGVSYGAMDVDGDGRVDVITAEGETDGTIARPPGGMIWWQAPVNRATGTWIKHTIDPNLEDVHNIRIDDMNGDGQGDIVFAEQDQSDQKRVGILFNVGGTGQNWQMQVLATDGGHNQWVADDDGDGDLDLLSSPHGFYSGFNPLDLFQNGLAQSSIVKPLIFINPTKRVVAAGSAVSFSVVANANAPLAYQWLRNGAAIAGATSDTYVISSVSAADSGAVFRCVVSDAAGFVNSAPASLTVIGPAAKPTSGSGFSPQSLGEAPSGTIDPTVGIDDLLELSALRKID